MKLLIKDITIISPNSTHHLSKCDVLVEGSKIKHIGKGINSGFVPNTIVEGEGKFLMPGMCDMYMSIPDPGHETAEDLSSGSKVALSGGFTDVCLIANTNPVVQSKSVAEYIIKGAQNLPIRMHPVAAATENLTENNPVEMYDLRKSGVIAFGNMPHSIQDFGALVRTLQYTQPLNALLFEIPSDKSFIKSGQVNESIISVKMGLKGIPRIAEVSAIQRIIKAMEYAGGKIHLLGITTAESIALIKEAKKEGLQITASVFAHHILFSEEDIADYDTNFKVYPPLRDKSDQKILIKALKEGVLDAICTQHTPLDIENKDLEFEYAHFGMIASQIALPTLYHALKKSIELSDLVKYLAIHPRDILNLPQRNIEEGLEADFIIFDPEKKWIFNQNTNKSKSQNSPFINKEIQGSIIGVFTNQKYHKVN